MRNENFEKLDTLIETYDKAITTKKNTGKDVESLNSKKKRLLNARESLKNNTLSHSDAGLRKAVDRVYGQFFIFS
ncbi:MAG: hypothetical protein GY754_37240 [bacterium]|nr:hypothetical protein [bacterium]